MEEVKTIDNKKLWAEALAEIELNISRANFATWFQNTNIVKNEDGTIYLNTPNTFIKEWLSNKYHKLIMKTLRNACPSIKNIEYLVGIKTEIKEKEETISKPEKINTHEEQLGFNDFYIDKESNLNPKYKFDSFIVGGFNEVAYAAAMAVTKNPGILYNPLFIYGGVGLGKTHLLQAIGNKLKETNKNSKVLYLTSEKFANEFITSIQNKDVHIFKEKYRKYNLLIIDDIQFFSGKNKIQEEFFHIFNSLYEGNHQIVFSADKPPKHMEGLEERLRSRCEGGMMVDVSKPEFESKLAILKAKAEVKGFSHSNEVFEYIANAVQDNIRELEGALNSIIGQSKIKGKILSINEIKELLNKNTQPIKTVSINQVIKTISDFYNIEEKYIFEKTRRKEVVKPRQVAMYLLRKDLGTSYPCIGKKFGNRDHTTVIYAYEKISKDIKKDTKLNQEIEQIKQQMYKTCA